MDVKRFSSTCSMAALAFNKTERDAKKKQRQKLACVSFQSSKFSYNQLFHFDYKRRGILEDAFDFLSGNLKL